MSIPELGAWRARWATPERLRLGIRADRIEDGFAAFTVDLRYGDDRDHDPLFASAAITHTADIATLSAVAGHIDERQQQSNGTASLHLNFLSPPTGVVTVEGRLVSWSTYEAILDVSARDERGTPVLKGLCTFSLRPKDPPAESAAQTAQPSAQAGRAQARGGA